jgi:hypothetical protein
MMMSMMADIREWVFVIRVKILLWRGKHDAFRTGR